MDTAAETEGGDSAGADDVTAGTGFTVAPKAVNPPTKPDPSAEVLTVLGAFIPVARRKVKHHIFSRYLNLASCVSKQYSISVGYQEEAYRPPIDRSLRGGGGG